MNLVHLKYAVEVAETGSINKASEKLYVSQPNLSRAIKELEASLGVTIFDRSAKGMVLTPDGGEVDMKGSKVAQFTPNGFILENVSHIPEDRNKMGLIGNMSVKDNIVLKATDSPEFSSAKGYFLKKKAIRDYALKMQEKYDIRCTSVEQETRNLSGGNQQKVILARELEGSPDLLVAVHPTRGLDIGATRFVHDTMIEARDKGCGVLLISADFDEILEVSDRIVVMFEGQIMGGFSGKNPPIEEISLAMAGK